ncbi:MAG: hypothetical protein K8J31_05380 [Anaerolineae bacterium]|nr:hypothetical protein [Anaerolineae bacterium]
MYGVRLAICGLILAGCTLSGEAVPLLPEMAEPTATPTAAAPAEFVEDVSDVMRGICFEAAFDAAGQVFVLRDTAAYIHFYDLADESHLCRHPVERTPFDFSSGRILAGGWSTGIGCTARHEIQSVTRDEATQQVTITVQFITEGSCDYELVRPLWLALDGVAGYAIDLHIAPAS